MIHPTPPRASERLPQGLWTVNAERSELEFSCRGLFGLWPVRGTFHRFSGFVEADGDTVSGELVVDSASLDTRLAFRDRHLRASDFFDVDRYPTFTVTLDGIDASTGQQPQFSATLAMRAGQTTVTGPLGISHDGDVLLLATVLTVPRAAAGLDQKHHGMVAATAHLSVELELARDSRSLR